MKSLFFEKYGDSSVLSIREKPKPLLEPGRVIVKVHAASLNPLDWRLMRADPFLIRMYMGLFKPKVNTLGADFSGVVDSVASDVSGVEVGDAVFGIMTPEVVGTLSEYIAIPATGVVKKPDTFSHQQASALGVTGLTAFEGIHDYRKPKAGERVLINGASGGIGTFAVQMAKALQAEVTAVCSGRNEDLVRELGADEVIDYQTVDLLQVEKRFDLVYDTIGNHTPNQLKPLLADQGRLVLASARNSVSFIQAMLSAKKDDAIDMIVDLKKDKARLEAMRDLVVANGIVPVIDRVYPFDEVVAAVDYVATKRARGKVVVNVIERQ